MLSWQKCTQRKTPDKAHTVTTHIKVKALNIPLNSLAYISDTRGPASGECSFYSTNSLEPGRVSWAGIILTLLLCLHADVIEPAVPPRYLRQTVKALSLPWYMQEGLIGELRCIYDIWMLHKQALLKL